MGTVTMRVSHVASLIQFRDKQKDGQSGTDRQMEK